MERTKTKQKGNIRDYANASQLVCLANLESLNAVFINEGLKQNIRLEKLNKIAISQMRILLQDSTLEKEQKKVIEKEKNNKLW